MPYRIFEQSRQRTWLAMGRDKEDREKDRVSDGQRERERNIIWLNMKSRCKLCICSFSQGAEVVFLTTSSCTVNSVRLV